MSDNLQHRLTHVALHSKDDNASEVAYLAGEAITALAAQNAALRTRVEQQAKAIEGWREDLTAAHHENKALRTRAETAEAERDRQYDENASRIAQQAAAEADAAALRATLVRLRDWLPDDIEIYRLIKKSGARQHYDIAKVIADHIAEGASNIAAPASLTGGAA